MSSCTPTFRWKSSYMGSTEYEVIDGTGVYCVEVRSEAGKYLRSIYNGTAEVFEREVVGKIGTVHRCNDITVPVPEETVAAFNSWRAEEHLSSIAKIESQPHRYGLLALNDPLRTPPQVVEGAVWESHDGWVRRAQADRCEA